MSSSANVSPGRHPFDLSGRRALVTGGTQGVGAAIATSLARAGADLLLLGLRDDDLARQTLAACRQAGVSAELLTVDLSEPPTAYLDPLLKRIDEIMPGIDLLVNNAGTYIDPPFFELDYGCFQKTMHLNVAAGFFLTQAIARRWVQDGVKGRVFDAAAGGVWAAPIACMAPWTSALKLRLFTIYSGT